MNFVPIRKQDLAIGRPLPWSVYDRQKNLLLCDGYVLETETQVDLLIEQGLFRKSDGDGQIAPAPEAAAPAAAAQRESPQKEMPFEEIKLQVGDPLQLQPLSEDGDLRYYVKLLGFLRGQAVLVTTPQTGGGIVYLKEGMSFVVRGFSGKSALAFTASILKSTSSPFPHLFLSYPKSVRGLIVRKGTRVRTKIIAAAHPAEGASGESAAITLLNISTTGAMFATRAPLGGKGDKLTVKFRLNLNDIESYLNLETVIRNIEEGDAGETGAQPYRHGVEFLNLSQQDLLMLTAYVYQKLLEESASK